MIGQDFKTGKYLGYRALLNRGFSRQRPPLDLDFEREQVVQEFIEQWTKGLADAGVSPRKIYSHTAFLSRRVFKLGDNKLTTYSQHNHFAPPSVAFGKSHRPGFSTYPQPGLFEQIYEELARHGHPAWASSEGTNLQLGSGPGQSGMGMETYLARMFNHGATLVNIFSWGVGGEARKNMDFRVVTEGEEACGVLPQVSVRRTACRGRLADIFLSGATPSENPPHPTGVARLGSEDRQSSKSRGVDAET